MGSGVVAQTGQLIKDLVAASIFTAEFFGLLAMLAQVGAPGIGRHKGLFASRVRTPFKEDAKTKSLKACNDNTESKSPFLLEPVGLCLFLFFMFLLYVQSIKHSPIPSKAKCVSTSWSEQN